MTPRREVLSPRNDGVERLMMGLPVDDRDRNDVRRWTLACMRAVSLWDIERSKARAALRSKGGR